MLLKEKEKKLENMNNKFFRVNNLEYLRNKLNLKRLK